MLAGVVAKENEMCRGVDYLHFELRSLSLKLIQGHYLQKEVQRVAEDLKKLLALRKSSTSFVASLPFDSLIKCVAIIMAVSHLF